MRIAKIELKTNPPYHYRRHLRRAQDARDPFNTAFGGIVPDLQQRTTDILSRLLPHGATVTLAFPSVGYNRTGRNFTGGQFFLDAALNGDYGVTGNYGRMQLLYDGTCRALYKWLNRRSQRKSLTWPAVNRLLARFQVPRPRIVEKQGGMPCQLELSLCQHLVHFPRRLTHPLAYARAS